MILCLAVTLGLSACTSGKDNESKTADTNKNLQLSINNSSKQSDEIDKADESDTVSTPSSQISIPSDKSGKTDKPTSNSSTTEFNEKEYQKLGEKLLKELEEKTASKITVLNDQGIASFMGYEPLERANKFMINSKIDVCAEITDVKEITSLKESLKIGQWQVDTLKTSSMPKVFIYFDDDLHVNLEAQVDKSWMSINSPSGNAFYLVPNEVYNNLLDKYGK